jgi:hypothetical protein
VERALLPAAFDYALTFDELLEGAAELGGLTFAGEFFFDRPGWRAPGWKSRSLVAIPSDSTRMSFLSWSDIFTLLLGGDRIMELKQAITAHTSIASLSVY